MFWYVLVICMYFHLSGCRWWCGRLFFSSLHTTILCVYAHFIDHLTHHHSSQKSFHHAGGGVGNSFFFFFFFFFPHTAICMYHPISLIVIHHNFHPIVMCSFICTKLQAPNILWGGWVLLNTNCYWFMESLDFDSA